MGHASSPKNELPREVECGRPAMAACGSPWTSMAVRLQRERNAPHAVPGCASEAAPSPQRRVACSGVGGDSGQGVKQSLFAGAMSLASAVWWLSAETAPLATTRFDHRPGCRAAVFPHPGPGAKPDAKRRLVSPPVSLLRCPLPPSHRISAGRPPLFD
jgi:hypothetical protein